MYVIHVAQLVVCMYILEVLQLVLTALKPADLTDQIFLPLGLN